MKKFVKIFLISLLTLFIVSCSNDSNSQSAEDKNFKPKVVKHDFGQTELKKRPKKIVILNNFYAEVLYPLGMKPIGATTGQAGSNEFASFVKDKFIADKVISVGWQKKTDLEKIAELEPDLILMTVHQKDLYEKLSQIAPTIGYKMDTEENWDFREPSIKVAEIFDKGEEMKKIISDYNTKEQEFAKKVKAKFPTEKLMYIRVTEKDIRYNAYRRLGFLYESFGFNRVEELPENKRNEIYSINLEKILQLNPDLMIIQADKPELFERKLKETPIWNQLKAVKNNKIIYAEYSLWQIGYGLLSKEKIMEKIDNEWLKK